MPNKSEMERDLPRGYQVISGDHDLFNLDKRDFFSLEDIDHPVSCSLRVELLASALGLCFFRNSAALRSVKTARPAMVHSRVEPSSMAGVGASSPPRGCAGCGGRIADRFLLFSMERYWHTHCLKCSCCQAQLGDIGTTCYSKGGMVLCRDDYIRLFGHSGACSACGLSIPASEMVMRAQGSVYHLKCFTCATCRNRLVPGDRFHYVNGTIFCEQDRPSGTLLSSHLTPLPDQKVC